MSEESQPSPESTPRPPRRKRYSGKNPKRYDEKYKELRGDAEIIAKVQESGKTPAGTHVPILLFEILEFLYPQPGHVALDCTLGYGGHAEEILNKITPNGCLIGLDADPVQLPETIKRLGDLGHAKPHFIGVRSNFAGAAKALAANNFTGVDLLLADLGVSSMQIDNPARGFSFKHQGPLDMRMNPQRGQSAGALLKSISVPKLTLLLQENADEPDAARIATELAGKDIPTTLALAKAVEKIVTVGDTDAAIRRVFQALRIAVNEEFTALDTLLRTLPQLLNQGGKAAILTFHSGEDRRVKKAFQAGLDCGDYADISQEVIRPTGREIFHNPRASSAKLRWAVRA